MMMEDFRDNLLKLLFVEKKLAEEDAEKQKNMSIEEKVENYLLLTNVTIKSHEEDIYELNVPDNYSKLRAGDKVIIKNEMSSSECEATIIDVFFDTLTISCEKELDTDASFLLNRNLQNFCKLLCLVSKAFMRVYQAQLSYACCLEKRSLRLLIS